MGIDARGDKAGVGGWLLVFVLLQVVGLGFALFSAWEGSQLQAQLEGAGLDPEIGLDRMLDFEISYHVGRSIGIVLGLVLILTRWSGTPLFWKVLLAASIAGAVYDIVLGRELVAKLLDLIPPEGRAAFEREMASELARSAGAIVGAVLWLLYWQFSSRVRATFDPEFEEVAPSTRLYGTASHGALPSVYQGPAIDDPSFGDRPTRECPSCGATNLVAAHYCRSCRTALPAQSG